MSGSARQQGRSLQDFVTIHVAGDDEGGQRRHPGRQGAGLIERNAFTLASFSRASPLRNNT